MGKIKVFYDKKGGTLSIWFDNPHKEVVSEEVGDGIILSKDKGGKVIGFEKLYVKLPQSKGQGLPFDYSPYGYSPTSVK